MSINKQTEGRGVGEGFTLPWNTTRTMADVFRMRDERSAKGGKATAAKKREQFVRDVQARGAARLPYAGYDKTEVVR